MLPKSSVSKNIKQLEQQLKTQLIIRNTRSMKLTDAGLLYFAKGKEILYKVDELEHEVLAMTGESEGKLRISLPLMIGEQILAPLLSEFVKEHSNIHLELDFSHHPTNLINQDFDIAFRTSSALADSSLFEVKLMPLRRIYVASPDYLKKNGKPECVSDLNKHKNLVFRTQVDIQSAPRNFENHRLNTNTIVSNSYQSLLTAAKTGCGIACVYDVLAEKELAQKSLINVFEQNTPEIKHLSMLYRQRGMTSQKISRFIAFFRSHPRFSTKQNPS